MSEVLLAERLRPPEGLKSDEIERVASIFKDLRRDRELAFCGAEDLTLSHFRRSEDALRTRGGATEVVDLVRRYVPRGD